MHVPTEAEFPPAGDLLKLMAENPLPQLPTATVAAATAAIEAGGPEAAAKQTEAAVEQLNTALAAGDTAALAAVFAEQAFFRDQLVLTYETRTFSSPPLAAAALLETTRLRQLSPTGFAVQGPAIYIPALPTLVGLLPLHTPFLFFSFFFFFFKVRVSVLFLTNRYLSMPH